MALRQMALRPLVLLLMAHRLKLASHPMALRLRVLHPLQSRHHQRRRFGVNLRCLLAFRRRMSRPVP